MQGALVRSLVRELRSCMLHGVAKSINQSITWIVNPFPSLTFKEMMPMMIQMLAML